MHSVKEKAANAAASAKVGMEKTKATVEEKVEKMATSDPLQKQLATEKKEEKIRNAKIEKEEARQQNAAAKHTGTNQVYTTGTGTGEGHGHQQVSALHGQGTATAQPTTSDTAAKARPIVPAGLGGSNIS